MATNETERRPGEDGVPEAFRRGFTTRVTDLAARALGYAARGWPVFPCKPGRKVPNTEHGFLDATTDPGVIEAWWRRWPQANIGIATGAPGPDVLDVDTRPEGSGFAALNQVRRAGLLTGALALVRTRSGGLHLYFTGTDQGCRKLIGQFLDFKAAGGYVIAPPSYVAADENGAAGAYELIEERDASGRLDWAAVRRLLDPPKPQPPRSFRMPVTGSAPARWAGVVAHLAALKDGDQRWHQLHWAARIAGELIAAGHLGEAEARAELLDASRANGYIADHGEREALRKIERGFTLVRAQ